MSKETLISESQIERLAKKIREEVFTPVLDSKIQVFLCGADRRKTNSIRGRLAEELLAKWYSRFFSIVYPEDIFDELLYGRNSPDLLSVESLLAENVDAVVIIPESAGSIAELGAFVGNPDLRKKIVCLIDEKYKKDKSFIMKGPVRLMSTIGSERVIYIDSRDMETAATRLRSVLRPLKSYRITKSSVTFFQVPNFLLPAIYLLEPVRNEVLVKLVSFATNDLPNARVLTMAGLAALKKEKHIELSGSTYKLTEAGFLSYLRLRDTRSRRKTQRETRLLDEIRLNVFNHRYRKKNLSV